MDAEEYQRSIGMKPVTSEKPAAAVERALGFGEWVALLAMCAADTSPAGVRDAAMIALFKIAGLRRVEIAGLNVGDYDATRQTLTVRGKRNKTRSVPIEDASALGVLADWLHLKGEGKFATVVYAYSQG